VDAAPALTRSTRALLVSLVVLLVFALLSAAPGRAEPTPSLAEAERQMAALGEKMGVATEQYNDAREDLKASRAREAKLTADMNQVRLKLGAYEGQLAAFADLSYRGGRIQEIATVLNSGSPQDLFDQLAFLEHLGTRRQGELNALLDAKKKVATAQARIAQEVDARAKHEQLLRVRRAAIVADLAKWEALRKRMSPKASRSADRGSPPPVYDGPAAGRARTVVQFAYAQLGKPYEWGADGPGSFDCSGLTMRAWAQVGVSMPHSASKQFRAFPKVPRSQLQPGDIVLFYSDLHHNGIYIGNGKMIHAPTTGDVVRIASITSSYMPYMGAVRPS
jgi:cell wall-associated NlpC family hydrolase